ncbi:MAG: thiamine kinase-like enzyme [Patiriisocius sp.]|jgi:thiamine kinase-like enzyme
MESSPIATKQLSTELLSTNPRLSSALADYQSITGAVPIQIETLQGTGNQSYKIILKDESVVLRLNADTRHLGVDRALEKRILVAISGRGITPQLKLWRDDYLVVEYIENSHRVTASTLATTLNTLHSTPMPQELWNAAPWTPPQTIRHYLALAEEIEDVQNIVAPQLELLDRFDWTSLPYGLCHIDLNPGNILQPKDGGPALLIDWEYSRPGPIAYDFAVYFETHHSSFEQQEALRSFCKKAPSRDQIKLCRQAYRLIELLWLQLTMGERGSE